MSQTLTLCLGIVLAVSLQAPLRAQVSVTGTLKLPDGTLLNGKVMISATKPTVTNGCNSGIQITLKPITVAIVSGVFPATNMFASTCLSPATGGSVTSVTTVGGSGFSGSCLVTFAGLAVSNTTGTCTFSAGTVNAVTLLNAGVYRTLQKPVVSFSCSPVCPGATQPAVAVGYSTGQLYKVMVYDSSNNLLYTSYWNVPNTGSVNITTLN